MLAIVGVQAQIAAPTASVEPGVIYNPAQVQLSAGATIYYTIDGSTPTTASAVYSDAINVDVFGKTTTIKAIASNGTEQSAVATFAYELKVGAPVINFESGIYEQLNGIEFTSATLGSGVQIIYTKDGSDPRTAEKPEMYWGYPEIHRNAGIYTYKAVAMIINNYYGSLPEEEDDKKDDDKKSRAAVNDTVFSELSADYDFIISPVQPYTESTELLGYYYYALNSGNKVATPISSKATTGNLEGKEISKNGKFIETNAYFSYMFWPKNEGEYQILDNSFRGLYMVEGDNNLHVSADSTTPGDYALWTVSISNKIATITNKATGKTISYDAASNSFVAGDNASNITLYQLGEYPKMDVTPYNYSTVESFSKFTITCSEGIAINENTDVYPYYQIGWMGEYYFNDPKQIDENTIEISTSADITDPNTYSIIIPNGLFILDPDGLAIESEYTYLTIQIANSQSNHLTVSEITPSNNSTVAKIDTILVYFDINMSAYEWIDMKMTTSWGDESNNWTPTYRQIPLTLTEGDGDITYFEMIPNTQYEDPETGYWYPVFPDNCLPLRPSNKEAVVKAGTYTMTLSKAWFTCWDMYYTQSRELEEDIVITITVDGTLGINDIVGDAIKEDDTIYDITGRVVKSMDTPGIYIVNGKKYIVK